MQDNLYNLIDTDTKTVLKKDIVLNAREAGIFNYAFALNGVSKRYVYLMPRKNMIVWQS